MFPLSFVSAVGSSVEPLDAVRGLLQPSVALLRRAVDMLPLAHADRARAEALRDGAVALWEKLG